MSKKLFIVGVGRSGTTLIMGMMNAHSKIAFIPETHFIKKYIVPTIAEGTVKASTLASQTHNDKDFQRLNTSLIISKENYNAKEVGALFWQTFSEFCEKELDYIGDKDPMNAAYLKQIHHVYPDSKILHIIRDPRDVVLSRIKSEWGKNTPFYMHVAAYHTDIHQALKDGPELFGENYFQFKYEDLLSDSPKVLKAICDWLDLPYEEGMLDFQEKAKSLIFSDEMSWKQNVLKPVIKNNSAKWKNELSNTQIANIESGIENLLSQLGYELSGKSSFFHKLFTSLPIRFAKLAFLLKRKKESIK